MLIARLHKSKDMKIDLYIINRNVTEAKAESLLQ